MCMLKMLFLLALLLLVNANNFSFTSWNITCLSKSNRIGLDIEIATYRSFISNVISTNPILDAVVKPFSEAFKDCYWCYPLYPCFQIGGPYITSEHPISLPPYSPCLMNVTMELYTTQNPTTPFVFYPNDLSPINQSNFNNNSETKVLIGGFFDGKGERFKTSILPALLAHFNFNVFVVNWKIGSETTYEQAVANARMAGAITCRFIQLLKNTTGHPLTKIHLLGHSLGAHVCGYAGECLLGELDRISGLDPAGPFFQNTDPVVRLSTNDAEFVDITHTNGGALGIDQKIGHVDFYPNGGSQQPGCQLTEIVLPALINNDLGSVILCAHRRCLLYYAESITNSANNSSCKFTSYACSDYTTFQKGSSGPCHTCGSDGERCAQMGINADQYAGGNHTLPAPEKFFLTTNSTPPYCKD